MTPKTAIKIMLAILFSLLLFHLCIVVKIIPYEITWGGRLKNDTEMYTFETISIAVNLLLVITLLIKGQYIKQLIPIKIVNIILWIFLVIFALNTIGNIFAKTNFEKLFTLLTLASVVLIWVILRKSRKSLDQ